MIQDSATLALTISNFSILQDLSENKRHPDGLLLPLDNPLTVHRPEGSFKRKFELGLLSENFLAPPAGVNRLVFPNRRLTGSADHRCAEEFLANLFDPRLITRIWPIGVKPQNRHFTLVVRIVVGG